MNDEENKQKVENAAQEAVRVIAIAAGEATKVVANAAAEAVKAVSLVNANNSGDHDLIIKLDTKMDALKEDIKMLNDGTSTKISDHELRLRRLEVWGFTAIGILLALQFYFNYIHK